MIRFAVISDLQYGDLDDTIGRAYRKSFSKFLSASGEIAAANVMFTLQLGDASQEKWENHLAIKELFDVAEGAGVRWRHVLGNHDFLVDDEKKPQLYEDLGMKKPGYYDFVVNDPDDDSNTWRFIVLNGNEISSYAAENDAEREAAQKEREQFKNANGDLPQPWNGSVSQTQLDWLEERLTIADREGERALLCSHFPMYAQSKSLDSKRTKLASLIDVGIYYSDLGISTWNGRKILEIMDRHASVKGYFAGHLHEGSYGVRKNVAHITFKGVVETSPNAFAFVELTPTSIRVEGREAQPSYQHDFQ